MAMACVEISERQHAALIVIAARHRASVEQEVQTAVAAYIVDVDAGLLAGPGETPAWMTRRRRLSSFVGHGRPRR